MYTEQIYAERQGFGYCVAIRSWENTLYNEHVRQDMTRPDHIT